MNNRPLFSIIIPVFNTSKYLKQCIESVINQSYKNYEIILVDDGSTDASGNICDEYSKIYKNISVIHKSNGGLSEARNFGLFAAQGEYVLFVDSDDYIARDSLERFEKYISIEKPEVIAAYGYEFNENETEIISRPFRIDITNMMTGLQFFSKCLYHDSYYAGAVYYIVKKSIIENAKLRFSKGIYHEDELWTPLLLLHVHQIYDLKYRYYYYRNDNIDSITRDEKKIRKRALDRIYVSQQLELSIQTLKGKQYNCLHDNISAQYMYGVYSGNLVYDKEFQINRFFPLKHARTGIYILKAIVFALSPMLACQIRKKLEYK